VKDVEVGKTHNLEYLAAMCAQYDPVFQNISMGNLSAYAVHVRYPDDFYVPSIQEAEESIKQARTVKDFVLAKIQALQE